MSEKRARERLIEIIFLLSEEIRLLCDDYNINRQQVRESVLFGNSDAVMDGRALPQVVVYQLRIDYANRSVVEFVRWDAEEVEIREASHRAFIRVM